MVASADQLATQAGMTVLASGGNAVDAAIATNAAIAITGPHLCGMGGDLFALVHTGTTVHALNSTGRAGSGADADALRAEGHREMPFRHDIRTVTVPGCVDGWVALHERLGTLPLAKILEPAIALARRGSRRRRSSSVHSRSSTSAGGSNCTNSRRRRPVRVHG
jgi:gamma-glutamyltranspeptidase/glutathione hydrolase